MRPAFSSIKAAASFGALLLALLLLPMLMGKSWLPPREQLYSSAPWGAGAFPYLHDQIFEETEPIDIAFMGSSRIWWGIDTPYVEKKLTETLGRKAVVRSLCWTAPGFDAFYFIEQDLLRRRKVRMIVFCDLSPGGANAAHAWAPFWFRWADNAESLSGVPMRSKVSFYASAILGMPRTLLCWLRPNLAAVPSDEISWPGFPHVLNPSRRLGSLALRMKLGQAFVDYTPPTNAMPSEVLVYSEATKDRFRFGAVQLPAMQTVFARKTAELAREHEVKLVCLRLPTIEERSFSKVAEPVFWPELLNSEVAMMGIPGASLFAGITEQEVQELYYNFEHFNQNGQEYFTKIVTPNLIRLYEAQTKP
jgi:hypothetical protein